MERIADQKRDFEVEKHKALGRGRPFSKVITVSKSLAEECEKLSLLCGLLGRDQHKLSPLGEKLMGASSDEAVQKLLGNVLLDSVPTFVELILNLSRLHNMELAVPLERDNKLFSSFISKYQLNFSQMDFEILRDWSTQVGILNWLVEEDVGERFTRVYLCSKVQESDGGDGDLIFVSSNKKYAILFNHTERALFRKTLWDEYLKMAKFVPRKPVFYSRLRAIVCYKLRVADAVFDREVGELIESDDQYLVVGSGGILPKTKDPASMLKYLPPKSERGDYIVYLRLDER